MGKKEVRHGHFKSYRNPTWPFIETVESDVKESDIIGSIIIGQESDIIGS